MSSSKGNCGGGRKAKKLKKEEPIVETSALTNTIAEHYNKTDNLQIEERKELRIFFMKNFNNWIKTMIIEKAFDKVEENLRVFRSRIVMDLGCGKGGDLKKYLNKFVHKLVCVDIAKDSIKICEERYKNLNFQPLYKLEPIHADVTRDKIIEKLIDSSMKFHIISSQFSFHYCFESIKQVKCMLENVSKLLLPGGVFIGTTPDAYDIITRLRQSETNSFENKVFKITFPDDFDKYNVPLFGAKYDFFLQNAVDCPEFLVYFPLLVKLAANYKLKLLLCQRFEDFFQSNYEAQKSRKLLSKLNALELYTPKSDSLRGNKDDYDYAHDYIKEHNIFECGTLSYPEWEAISLYLVFMFEKQK